MPSQLAELINPVGNAPAPAVPATTSDPNQPTPADDLQQHAIQEGPPANAEELQTRKEGWRQVIDKFASDPNMQRMLLFMGANMMQGREVGQTDAGLVGQSIFGGVEYANAAAAGQKAQQLAERQVITGENRAATERYGTEATVAQRGAELDLQGKKLDESRRQFDQDLNLRRDTLNHTISFDTDKLKLDKERMKILWGELGVSRDRLAQDMRVQRAELSADTARNQATAAHAEMERQMLEVIRRNSRVQLKADGMGGFVAADNNGKMLYRYGIADDGTPVNEEYDPTSGQLISRGTVDKKTGNYKLEKFTPQGTSVPGAATGPGQGSNLTPEAIGNMPDEQKTTLRTNLLAAAKAKLDAKTINQKQYDTVVQEINSLIPAANVPLQ